MALTVKPILPRFGAEVSGIDFTRPFDETTRRDVAAAMDQWGVCVFRGTGMDDARHIAFSGLFGQLEHAPVAPGRNRRSDHPEIFDASNLDREGHILDPGVIATQKKGDRLWHTDSSYMTARSSYSLLLAHEVPPVDGQTFFADTRSAYDDLPQAMKDRIEHLELDHSYWYSRQKAGFDVSDEEIDARPKARWPLVNPQPSTGRRSLFIGAHACDVVGMQRAEGRKLIAELVEWATRPEYVFGVTYAVGDMTMWDNLATMHRGGEFDAEHYRRDMRRTTVRAPDAPPAGIDQFTDYFRASGPAQQPQMV